MVRSVVVCTVQARERIAPEEVAPHAPPWVPIASQPRVRGAYFDHRCPRALGKQIVEREMLRLLREHEQEPLVVAAAIGARDAHEQGILDGKEISEMIEEVD